MNKVLEVSPTAKCSLGIIVMEEFIINRRLGSITYIYISNIYDLVLFIIWFVGCLVLWCLNPFQVI